MAGARGFFGELRRRNIFRAAAIYLAAVWALAQGFAQLQPVVGAPEWITRALLVAAAIGFPFWIAFAWFYEFTPAGLKRESEVEPGESIARATGRKLDYWIIGILAVVVVLLLTERLMPSTEAQAAASGKSIAVLPFENLSGDRDGEYFVVGMQDEILTRLANIGDLKVVSRTSTEKYRSHAENLREVGRELGVDTIVEGSVQRAADKVRISVQLIDAASDTHLWAHSYDRQMHDVFAVQSDVAGRIASALKLKLQPAEAQAIARAPTADPMAYDLFLRAEYLADRGGTDIDTVLLEQSLAPYQRAIARDPSFALALARLSYAQSLLAWFGEGIAGLDADALAASARSNAERALALDPELADAYVAKGFSDYYGRRDYDAALAAFATAQRLRPNDASAMAAAGYVYRRLGRLDDSIRKLEEALDHDPRNSRIAGNLAATYMVVRRYAEAEDANRRALAADPDNVTALALLSAAILNRTGDPARALAVLQSKHPTVQSQRVLLLWMLGRYPEALAVLESIPDTPDNFGGQRGATKAAQLAWLYRDMGDAAQAHRYYLQAESGSRQALVDAEAGGDPVTLAQALQYMADVELGLGRTAEALRLTDRAQALVEGLDDTYLIPILVSSNAFLYASAGRADRAVPLLDRILASPIGGMAYSSALLPIDPDLDPIRDDPRFIALLKKYPPPMEAQGDAPRGTAIPVR